MPNQEQRVLLWCVAVSSARSARLLSVFVSDNSPTAGATPQGTNKDPKKRDEERVRSRTKSLAPAFFFAFFPPMLTCFFMHNRSTNDDPISIHSQALSPLPSLCCPCVAVSFCLIFLVLHIFFSPPPTPPLKGTIYWRMKEWNKLKQNFGTYICTYMLGILEFPRGMRKGGGRWRGG